MVHSACYVIPHYRVSILDQNKHGIVIHTTGRTPTIYDHMVGVREWTQVRSSRGLTV